VDSTICYMQTLITLTCQRLLKFYLVATKLKVSVSDLFEFSSLMMEISSVSEKSVCFWQLCKKSLSGPVMLHRGAFR
jgi:hypothetical protein